MIAVTDPLEVHLCAELAVEEAKRRQLYDDATGRTFNRGDTLKGFLTGGVGHNFMTGLDDEDIQYFLLKDIRSKRTELAPYAWFSIQDVVRQAALVDLAFNLGAVGLLHWPHFLAYMASKNYPMAVEEIRNNAVWVAQVGTRATRLESMFETGQWPSDIHV